MVIVFPKVAFGAHTIELKHRISRKEAVSVKAFFGLPPTNHLKDTTYFFQNGINELEVLERQCKYNGAEITAYTLRIRLNLARASGMEGYGIMPLTGQNIKKVCSSMNRILRNTLQLNNENSSLEEWTIQRLDTAFDIYVDCPELLVLLLNISLVLPKKRNCTYKAPRDDAERRKRMFESVRFGNKSYTYNAYVKLKEIESKGKPLTDAERAELKHLLRIERQNLISALKALLPDGNKFGALSSKKTISRILTTMLEDIECFWGRGDFYCGQAAVEIFRNSGTVNGIREELSSIYSWNECYRNGYSKQMYDTLAKFGIAPAFLTDAMVETFKTEKVQGLYNTVTQQFPKPEKKRDYHKFPVPHKAADGRYKVNLSLHIAGEYPSVKKSAYGRTIEECEKMMFQILYDAAAFNSKKTEEDHENQNYREMRDKSLDDLNRFFKTAQSSYIKNVRKKQKQPGSVTAPSANSSSLEAQALGVLLP